MVNNIVSRSFLEKNVPYSKLPEKIKVKGADGKKVEMSGKNFRAKLAHDIDKKQINIEKIDSIVLKKNYGIAMNDLEKRRRIMKPIKEAVEKRNNQ
jgi:hypothetical protein